MNPSDIPPDVFINSFLKSASNVSIEATVIYTVEKNGKRKTTAASNKGPEGVARAANVLKFGDGSIERAAVAMHTFRVKPPENVSEEMRAAMAEELNAFPCYICHLSEPWEQLDEVDKTGHRELVKVALGAALQAMATSPLVSV